MGEANEGREERGDEEGGWCEGGGFGHFYNFALKSSLNCRGTEWHCVHRMVEYILSCTVMHIRSWSVVGQEKQHKKTAFFMPLSSSIVITADPHQTLVAPTHIPNP